VLAERRALEVGGTVASEPVEGRAGTSVTITDAGARRLALFVARG
jgi:hypothetical protein